MPQNQIPFKIIPLQTIRKENNWKTEEALVQLPVTPETERVKSLMFMMMMMVVIPTLLFQPRPAADILFRSRF